VRSLNIYLVRHCKANGQEPDAPLTEEGRQQANRLAELLYTKEIDCILSSPFVRATDSVAPLAKMLQLNIVTDERLAERILCGGNHPNWRDMLRNTFDDLELCYEGGESSAFAMSRAMAVIGEIRDSLRSNIVITTHGNLMALLLKACGAHVGFEEWEGLSNPDVYLLKFDGTAPTINRIWSD
jgi:2,3-bisphosphoglycerate-dependent phosphoglycerate mutase